MGFNTCLAQPLIINSYRLNLKYHANLAIATPIYKIYRIPIWNYLGKMLAMPKILWYGVVCACFGQTRIETQIKIALIDTLRSSIYTKWVISPRKIGYYP